MKALWWIASTYSIGFVVGPAVNLVFKGIDFHVLGIHVTYLNFVGMFMACLLLASLLVNNLLIHDCSNELDLKQYLKDHQCTTGDLEEMDEHSAETTPLIRSGNMNYSAINESEVPLEVVLKAYCSNTNLVLMFSSTFFFMYVLFSSDVLLPLICLDTFGWSITSITYIFIIYGGGYFLVLLLMSALTDSPSRVFHSTLLCMVLQMLQLGVLVLIGVLQRDGSRDVVLMVFFLIFWSFAWCLEEVLLRSLTSAIVPSSVQSFTEATRAGVARLSTIVAALTAPLLTSYLHWWAGVLIVVTLILFVCFVVNRRSLRDPDEIDLLGGQKL